MKLIIMSTKINNLLSEYSEIELSSVKKQIIDRFLLSKIEMLAEVFDREEE